MKTKLDIFYNTKQKQETPLPNVRPAMRFSQQYLERYFEPWLGYVYGFLYIPCQAMHFLRHVCGFICIPVIQCNTWCPESSSAQPLAKNPRVHLSMQVLLVKLISQSNVKCKMKMNEWKIYFEGDLVFHHSISINFLMKY